MPRLRERSAPREAGHEGEVYGCAYSQDGALVLSAGWDGCLGLWEAASGRRLTVLRAGGKPLSACAFSPDGRSWVSGSSEGVLTFWDGLSHQPQMQLVAHLRPISAIQYSANGQLATASWDRQIVLRLANRVHEGRSLSGHTDIVAGIQFSRGEDRLLSWSHDRTLCLWSLSKRQPLGKLSSHRDRVTAAALSADGKWILSGGRDGRLKVWDAQTCTEVLSLKLGREVRVCAILPSSNLGLSVDLSGTVTLWSLPQLEALAQYDMKLGVMCGELAASGDPLALGCDDGRVHQVLLEDLPPVPLPVVIEPRPRARVSLLERLMGHTPPPETYQLTCPACSKLVELGSLPSPTFSCPSCNHPLQAQAAPGAEPAPLQEHSLKSGH